MALGDESHNPFGDTDASWAERVQEVARAESKNNKRMNARAMQRQRDTDAWEANRMLQSGGMYSSTRQEMRTYVYSLCR